MNINESQIFFLQKEFSIIDTDLIKMRPLSLWKLREACIQIECDEAMLDKTATTERGDMAAGLVNILSSLLPAEWKRLTPSEVEAMQISEPMAVAV